MSSPVDGSSLDPQRQPGAVDLIDTTDVRRRIEESLRTVFDPELPVNIFDLGLIYAIDIDSTGHVRITMTLTTPNCPVAELLPRQVRDAAASVDDVRAVDVTLTWEPPWSGERMAEDARLALEMMGISWKEPHHAHGTPPASGMRTTNMTVGRTASGRAERPATDNDSARPSS